MSIKKKLFLCLICVFVVILNVFVVGYEFPSGGLVELEMTLRADVTDTIQVYYNSSNDFGEEKSTKDSYENKNPEGEMGEAQTLRFSVDTSAAYLRLDLGTQPGNYQIEDVTVSYRGQKTQISVETLENYMFAQQIDRCEAVKNENGETVLEIEANGDDPYLTAEIDISEIREAYARWAAISGCLIKIFVLLCLDLGLLVLLRFRKKLLELPAELFHNRGLILSLAKNDFKTKYAGSYLGIVWAFIQPVVTVLVYWFVFQVGLRSSGVGDVPFVLWMIAGLVPWFFFSDTLNSGTSALIEYSYLVKKVVFKISILPLVKEMSALFVHVFFVAFTVALYLCYGYAPDVYTLQVIYYTFCLFVLALGLCYATCSIVIFFRDLSQIINIILQIGVWVTPIMWNIDGMNIPKGVLWIFKANPLYYVVAGYRDSLINKVWFFEHFAMTVYFWVFTIAVFAIGTIIFKRLKVHFADVL